MSKSIYKGLFSDKDKKMLKKEMGVSDKSMILLEKLKEIQVNKELNEIINFKPKSK